MSTAGAPRPAGLTLLALGVVFGDIGTSPLYAVRQCFSGSHPMPVTPERVVGVLSLLLWTLLVVVAVKYVLLVMRVDNRGEGGILALLATLRSTRVAGRSRRALLALGLFGGALLYGDGVITPAISVLGALEGVEEAAPAFGGAVLPMAVVILVGLFLVQRRGTARVGAAFGPVILLWFVVIAALGILGIAKAPAILAAMDPRHAVGFFLVERWTAFFVLGAVLLVVTGAEALYADMGHFGRAPIRRAWFGVVLPALVLNYLGQGGLLLQDPTAIENPFYLLVPRPFLVPAIVLATAATVIASQALISGTFSLTRQAVQLGYSPRLVVQHTSETMRGQIYVPAVNWALMLGCVALVLAFRSTSGLAGAYGVAVSATMLITTVLAYVVVRRKWNWSRATALAAFLPLALVDLALFSSSLVKVPHGGWVPLVIAALLYVVLVTWNQGRVALHRALPREVSMERTLANIRRSRPSRVPGTAVFLVRSPDGVPTVLLHHLKHNRVLHERVVLLTVIPLDVPYADEEDRVQVQDVGDGFWRVLAGSGFMENPNVPAILEQCKPLGLEFDLFDTTFVLGRTTMIATGRSKLPRWRLHLFAFLSRNATPATHFFGLPPNRVMELGAQVQL